MIHDRFYSQWVQPPALVQAGEKLAAVIRIRIEKDGTISSATLAQSSGNDIMDQSVMAAARRVTKIDPLPDVITDDHYVVQIALELTPD